MSTEAINRSRRAESASATDRDERAQRAVKVFRGMQHGLTAYARAITGNKKVRVEINSGPPRTDGTIIFYRPPIALGDKTPHDRFSCDKRDEVGLLVCPACKLREEVLVNIYHEIAHIAYGSFEQTTDKARRIALKQAVEEWGGKYEQQVRDKIAKAPFAVTSSYQGLSSLVSPFLPYLVNCIEDARVDSSMFEARKGTKKMLTADTLNLLREGIPNADGELQSWHDAPINSQASIACYLTAAGYEGWMDHLHPKIADDFTDPMLVEQLGKVKHMVSAEQTYFVAFPVLARLRELGYFKLPEEEEPEPQPEEQPEPESQDSDDNENEENDEQDESERPEVDEPEDGDDGGDDGDPGDGEDSERGDGEDSSSDAGGESDGDGGTEDGEHGDQPASGPDEDAAPEDGADSAEPEGDGADEGDDAGSSPADAEGEAPDDGGGEAAGGDQRDGGEEAPDASGGADEADEGDRPEGDSDAAGDDAAGEEGDALGEDAEAPGEGGAPEGPDADPEGGQGEEGGEVDADTDGVPEEPADGPEGDGGVPDDAGAAPGDMGPSEAELGPDGAEGEADADDEGPDAGSDPAEGDDLGEGLDHGAPAEDADGHPSDGGELDDEQGEGQHRGSEPDPSASDAGSDSEDDSRSGDEDRERGDAEGPDDEDDSPVEAIDSGADEGKGGARVEFESVPEQGTPDDVENAVSAAHPGHDQQQDIKVNGTEAEQQAVDTAVIQGMYFETPSTGVSDVVEHKYSPDAYGWAAPWDERTKVEFGVVCDVDIPEQVLGPIVLKTRRIFNDNKTATYQPNLRSGRVNAKVLGRRAWKGDDDRLFGKKRIPGKRDYAVMIGLDISTSNRGSNIALVKRAVFAQAELLARVGIKFSIVAHSARGIGPFGANGFVMDLHHVKGWDEPWDVNTRQRVADIVPVGGNLDGHAMEYMRNQLGKVDATDKVLLYYTDGKMPAANADEEREVLERQITLCKRDQIVLLGVGIRTDSPVRHGLDTVQVNDDDDLKTVVEHLGKRLLHRAR